MQGVEFWHESLMLVWLPQVCLYFLLIRAYFFATSCVFVYQIRNYTRLASIITSLWIIFRNQNLAKQCKKFGFADDGTLSAIVTVVLDIPLVETYLFHSPFDNQATVIHNISEFKKEVSHGRRQLFEVELDKLKFVEREGRQKKVWGVPRCDILQYEVLVLGLRF